LKIFNAQYELFVRTFRAGGQLHDDERNIDFDIGHAFGGSYFGLGGGFKFGLTKAALRVKRRAARVNIGADKPPASSHLDLLTTGKAFVEVAQQVMPTVVSVTSSKVVRAQPVLEFFTRNGLAGLAISANNARRAWPGSSLAPMVTF
jgi:hypothetical protein